ncbi:unnamed protein product, partial [Mycena citricolor]
CKAEIVIWNVFLGLITWLRLPRLAWCSAPINSCNPYAETDFSAKCDFYTFS